MIRPMLALALSVLAAPALAQEPGGVVMGSLNGQPLNCQIWPAAWSWAR